jgi:hypothetical protein
MGVTMNINMQRELLSFDEKIALAELEEAKAAERVKELKYHKARFSMDYFLEIQKVAEEKQKSNNAS